MHPHHIRISFNQIHFPALCHAMARQVEAIQKLRLVEHLTLWAVQVLRCTLFRLRGHHTPAKSHTMPMLVRSREDDTPLKEIVIPPVLIRFEHPKGYPLTHLPAFLQDFIHPRQGVPNLKVRQNLLRKPSLLHILLSMGQLWQIFFVIFFDKGNNLPKGFFFLAFGFLCFAFLFVCYGNIKHLTSQLHRFGEVHTFICLDKLYNGLSPLSAGKVLPYPLHVRHHKAWCAFIGKRRQPLSGAIG